MWACGRHRKSDGEKSCWKLHVQSLPLHHASCLTAEVCFGGVEGEGRKRKKIKALNVHQNRSFFTTWWEKGGQNSEINILFWKQDKCIVKCSFNIVVSSQLERVIRHPDTDKTDGWSEFFQGFWTGTYRLLGFSSSGHSVFPPVIYVKSGVWYSRVVKKDERHEIDWDPT